MKILHIFDLAGVAYVISKWQNKAGHKSTVINQFDPFGFSDFYKEGNVKIGMDENIIDTLDLIAPEYDILHLHSIYQLLPQLAKYRKPIVIHYHGSELVETKEDPWRQYCERFTRAQLVVNEYMLPYHNKARFLPNPVDTEHFKPDGTPTDGMCFTMDIPYLDREKLEAYLVPSEFPHPTYYSRAHEPIPYSLMPKIIKQHSGYIDIKFHKEQGLLPALSTTGLQALACGLRVLNWKKEWVEGLPEQHEPENVVRQLDQFYTSLIRK